MATTVTAWASADSDPLSNPDVDLIIDLSTVALPQLAQQLYGAAWDTADPTNTHWAWSWVILDDDSPTNPTTLSSAVVKDPTLDVPTWRNIRLFLIVQNTVSGEFSERNPLLAPDSAFVVARVLSVTAGIQKLADGERNYGGEIHRLVDQVEAGAVGVGAHTIASHTDTTATGAELDTLTSGGSASGLHTHLGADIPLATALLQGAVLLEETGTGAAKVVTRERMVFEGDADASRVSGTYTPGAIVPATYETDQTVATGVPLIIWRAQEARTLVAWSIQMVDGGSTAPTHPYRFRLGHANSANALAGAWSDLGVELTGEPTTDHGALILKGTISSYALPVGEYLALFCIAAPRTAADGDTPGGGLHAQVFGRREV